MTLVSAIAAGILSLLRVGDATADRHAMAIYSAADSLQTASELIVIDFRESRYLWSVERCSTTRGDGRGSFQTESHWGTLATRCGPLPVQAKRAADAVESFPCHDDDSWCRFEWYAGLGKHQREVAERTGIVWLTRRRLEALACVMP